MGIHHLIKMDPKTPFHLGEMMDMERTEDIIHSDTLFSALCHISDKSLGKDNYRTLIQPFIENNPPFLISSAFPYCETEEDTLYFFPKPLIFKNFVDRFPKNIKTFKKIRFVSKKIFDAYLTGDDEFLEHQFQDLNGNIKRNHLIQGNQIWLSKEESKLILDIENLWKIQQEPRITIDRITKQTTIYHYSRAHYHKKAGLFVLIRINKESESQDILKDIITKFRYLGDTGIGGERSLGNGQFDLKLNEDNNPFTITFKDGNEDSKRFIALSLLLPRKNEIEGGLLNEDSYYQIINRRGWISNSTFRRKSINMIIEGSVLSRNGKNVLGKIEDVTPEIISKENPNYKIHRYGYSYSINIKN